MGDFIKILDNINSIAVKADTAVGLYGGLATTAVGFVGNIIRAIQKRQAAGEDATDLIEALQAFGHGVDSLKAANDAYWLIPEKPADAPADL